MSYLVKWQAKRGLSEIYFDNIEDAKEWALAHNGELWLKITVDVDVQPA